MKRIIRLFFIMCLLLTVFTGCGNSEKKENKKEDRIEVVTTVFPLYDWCRVISDGANKINVTKLVSSSSDMHSYQPSAQDIAKISTCDVFVYVGGESDEWVEDVLKQTVNSRITVINLMDVLQNRVVLEEQKEGMEADDEEEPENDEHVWLSLKNAMIACDKIADILSNIDVYGKDIYKKNLDEYIRKLNDLDGRYQDAINGSVKKTLLFADRFPFRYLCEDYGLDYYAAFKGCSAESEASFETIRFLSEKTDELDLKAVLCIEGSDKKIATTVVENTASKDQEILMINSLQSNLDENDTYLDIMTDNLDVIEKALS